MCLGGGRSKAGCGWSVLRWGVGEGGVTDTLVFDSSGGHHLRGKRVLMGILSSRQAQASARSSLAAINSGKYASLD